MPATGAAARQYSEQLNTRRFDPPQDKPLPKPWRPPLAPVRPVPAPANVNRPRPPNTVAVNARALKALGLLGLNPGDVLAMSILDQWKALFAQPDYAAWGTFGGLPKVVDWPPTGVGHCYTQNPTFLPTQEVGQAFGSVFSLVWQGVAGAYVSTAQGRRISPSGLFRWDEEASWGPAPATGLYGKPWYRPGTYPRTLVFPPPVPWPFIPLRPTTGLIPVRDVGPAPLAPPATPPPPMKPRRPPGPNTKERKIKATGPVMGILRTLQAGTEALDFMDAFYDALPDSLKAKFPRGMKKWEKEVIKAKLVYKHWDKIDLDSALFNALWENAVVDKVWAKASIPTKLTGRSYGTNFGANKIVAESFRTADVSGLLKNAKGLSQGWLNHIPGLTLK